MKVFGLVAALLLLGGCSTVGSKPVGQINPETRTVSSVSTPKNSFEPDRNVELKELAINTDCTDNAGKKVICDKIKTRVVVNGKKLGAYSSDVLYLQLNLTPIACDDEWTQDPNSKVSQVTEEAAQDLPALTRTYRYFHLAKPVSSSCVGLSPRSTVIEIEGEGYDLMNGRRAIKIYQSNYKYAVVTYVSKEIDKHRTVSDVKVEYDQN